MQSKVTLAAAAIATLAGLTNAAAIQPEERRGATTCATDSISWLMVILPRYAAPFCSAAVNIVAKTPTVTITATPTV